MKSGQDIKLQLQKKWQNGYFHKAWLAQQQQVEEQVGNTEDEDNVALFPYVVSLDKITEKKLLNEFDAVNQWTEQITQFQEKNRQYLTVQWQIFSFPRMGKQKLPTALEFHQIEDLARFLGCYQQWQLFVKQAQLTLQQLPQLIRYVQLRPIELVQHLDVWPQLLKVCQYFLVNPKPGCYLRELNITGIDTKFIEQHKAILKKLLDATLPESAIELEQSKLSEHGFEKRYGLNYPKPRIRFRVLDPNMIVDLAGFSDLEVSLDEFAKLGLLCDSIYITENKTNGLAFPKVKNAIVIFGLGYGISALKQVDWLKQCRIYYWGDIDTHGFAILSQIRAYLPDTQSFLMDKDTLQFCRAFWTAEPQSKRHQSESLANLTDIEQALYQALKTDHFAPCLRLEQERIPYHYWLQKLPVNSR